MRVSSWVIITGIKQKMSKDILSLVKQSGAARKFKESKIHDELLIKILEAGRWGLSILGIQPWKLVCVKKRKLISDIGVATYRKSKEIEKPFSMILKLTSGTIKNSKALIAIYNNSKISERTEKYGEPYISRGKMAELQCIGGSIQNMVLEAYSLGLGCVWLDSPTFFSESEINKILNQNAELIAILALGYPVEEVKRSKRADYNQMIEIIR